LLNYYKHILRVRKNTPALIEGEYQSLQNTAKDYFAFLRVSSEQTVLVVLNFSEQSLNLDLSRTKEIRNHNLRTLFSSAVRSNADLNPKKLHIGAFEVFIAEVK